MEQLNNSDTTIFEHFLQAEVSRRTLFKAAGAAGAALWMSQAGLLREAAAAAETVQDILDITVTVEHFGVTFLGYGIDNIRQGRFSKPVPANVLAVLEAARAQEQFHLDFFTQAGGKPLTTTFTLPDPALVSDYDKFFTALVEEETRETALGIAAMNTFTAMQRPDLVKVMFQYAAEESEHRLLANYARGARPANDRGFAPALYASAADLVAELRRIGIVGGSGPAITYPGPGQIDPTN
ncbi:MAG TPA: ferritin-like domain-containing protein, partial [Thermomicrobiales bacterium]